MAKIFIVQADGSKTVVSLSQLKEFAASGRIHRDTILEANDKTARAGGLRELAEIFDARDAAGASTVVAPPPLDAPPPRPTVAPSTTIGTPPRPTVAPSPTIGTPPSPRSTVAPPQTIGTPPRPTVAPPPTPGTPSPRSAAPFPNARAVVPPPLESTGDAAPSGSTDDSRATVAAADLNMEVSDLFTTRQVREIAGRRIARTKQALELTQNIFHVAWGIVFISSLLYGLALIAEDGEKLIRAIIGFGVANLPFVFLYGFIRAVRDNTEYRAEDAVRQELYLAEILKRSK